MANGRKELTRHRKFEVRTDESIGLRPTNKSAIEGRTIFRDRVLPPTESARMLISGVNNRKIGSRVLKGPWAGMPIFTLTLEERATCPRSCAQWLTCYGSAMQWPSRWDVNHQDFMWYLAAEVTTVARANPKGFVVRLHVLGDFFSVKYVEMWAMLLDHFPQLHVFGYTARREDADDEESRKIAKALRWLSDEAFDQFALRFSRSEIGRKHAIVVDKVVDHPDVIMCPAQSDATATCGTCGLCWSEAAQDKTIAFLRHGVIKSSGRGSKISSRHKRPSPVPAMPAELLRPLKHFTLAGTFDCKHQYENGLVCGRRTMTGKDVCPSHFAKGDSKDER